MIRSLYDWVFSLAANRHALWVLAVISFIESSVFPIPPDVLLVPMVLAAREKAWLIAGVCTVASVLGGLAGYAIGYFAMEEVGRPVLEFYGKSEKFDEFSAWYNSWGDWAVFFAGVTPFPYKVITIMSGATGLDVGVFTVSSVAARALRFFVVAALLWRYGAPMRDFIENRLGLVFSVTLVLLFGGFAVARYAL